MNRRISLDIRAVLAGLSILVALTLALPSPGTGFETPTGIDLEVSNILRNNLQTETGAERLKLQQPALVSRFYTRLGFRPAWTKGAKALPEAQELSEALRDAFAEGLNPDYYNLVDIEVGLRNLQEAAGDGGTLTPERIAWIEILISDAYFAYASDLITGRVKPMLVVEDARVEAIKMELSGFLIRMLRVGWIKDSLESLSPRNPEYQRLKKALAIYRKALSQGGWKSITTQMKRGDRGIGVKALRDRLMATHDLMSSNTTEDEKLFNSSVAKAVRRFQGRHGLEADGMVGPVTLETLNAPVETRIKAIELNMERLRWLPRELGKTYVLVNLADFTLKAVSKDAPDLKMRVIIGKDFQSTPSFSSKMTSLVLNPYWNIPQSIARDEIVPILQNSPGYLEERGIEILMGWGDNEHLVNPRDIDLVTIADPREGLRLRQKPGGANPMGKVKLLMPNRFNIYLHDTPADYLFQREVRTFSHGCIRLEKPQELAAFAMRKSPRWSRNKIQAAINTGSRYELNLPEPLDVMVLYQSAWAADDGRVTFRHDIYGRDRELDRMLRETVQIPASEGLPN
ncbi:MAG: L,D-transpeptidase family protein [Thermodesulfovibrionales bacterium]|nr:L,D-transpeptidase family protein [Thermodesulfovibrionales bacterium]